MISIIKQAAIYTGVYFLLFTLFFWAAIFVSITAQVFFKLFVAIFIIAVAVLTFNHFDAGKTLQDLWKPKAKAEPTTIEGVLV